MIRTILTFLFVALCICLAYSEPISKEIAQKVAQNYFQHAINAEDTELVLNIQEIMYQGKVTRYAVNFINGGYVLLSADDSALPILGYSDKSIFDENKTNPALRVWLVNYDKQITYCIDNRLPNTETSRVWQQLLINDFSHYNVYRTQVEPLLTTEWGQKNPYNGLCPGNPHAVTGCAATAIAQIMKYHNYPAIGMGSNLYSTGNYSNISSNFYEHTYFWDWMPDSLIEDQNDAPANVVKQLMYDAGVAEDMNYGIYPNESSATIIDAYQALKDHFQYSNEMRILFRSSFQNTDIWTDLIANELDQNRPIFYSGVGHAFVCDGYDNQGLFHFNWGWNGDPGNNNEGYFVIDNLNTDHGDFSINQHMIVNIKPDDSKKMLFPIGAQNDLFGYSVDCYDDYILVNNINHHNIQYLNRPCIEVFKDIVNDGISLVRTLESPYIEGGDFGYDFSINNGILVVGSPAININGLSSGVALIYENFTNLPESPNSIIQPPTGINRFGCSVDLDGDYCIIGSQNQYAVSDTSGSAFVYKRNTDSSWALQQELITDSFDQNDLYGSNVAISGNYAIVSAPRRPIPNSNNHGRVLVFKRILTTWVLDATLVNPEPENCDQFGFTADIYGDYIIIGSKLGTSVSPIGKAFIYGINQNEWQLQTDLYIQDGLLEVSAVKMYDHIAAVGYRDCEDGNLPQNRVILYEFVNSEWSTLKEVQLKEYISNDQLTYTCMLASDLALSSNMVVIGTPWDVPYGQNSGSAFKYPYNPSIVNYVTIVADTTSGEAPLTVHFSVDSNVFNNQYEWDFNNDAVIDSYESSPSYTYNEPGDYLVTLYATNLSNLTSTLSITVLPTSNPLNLVASYSLNGNAEDISEHDNNGTMYGTTAIADRFLNANSALNFNGSSNYISVPNSADFDMNIEDSYTISLWVKPSIANLTGGLIEKWNGGTGNPYPFSIRMWAGKVHYGIYQTGGDFDGEDWAVSPYTIPINEWTHILCRKDGSSFIELYINGELVSGDYNLVIANIANTANLRFGRYDTHYFKGSMDDIRFFRNCLNQTQITQLTSEGGWCSPPKNLTAHFMDDSVNLNWEPTVTDNAEYYRIYRGINQTDKTLIGTTEAGQCSYVDTNINSDVSIYYYHVCSVGYSGIESPISNIATASTGKYSLSFDGSNDYISVGNQSVFNELEDQLTISAWIKPIDDGSPYDHTIVSKLLRYSSNGFSFYLGYWAYQNDNQIHFNINNHTTADLALYSPLGSIQNNQWTHIDAVYNGIDLKLYINGVLSASRQKSGFINPNSDPLEIGARHDHSSYRFEGKIDEVRIWKRALSQSELSERLYRELDMTCYSDTLGLIGYWKLNEGIGTVANDYSAYHNNGTLINGPTWSLDIPQIQILSPADVQITHQENGITLTWEPVTGASSYKVLYSPSIDEVDWNQLLIHTNSLYLDQTTLQSMSNNILFFKIVASTEQ
jgi:PKD repeat protein